MDLCVAEKSSDATRPTLNGFRILLVEDSWIVAQSLKAMLELIGATVIGPATSLEDATSLANASPFDVAIMDMDLQGEMADKLICALHWRGLPVVVVTGCEVQPEIADKVVAVMQKPIRVEALLSILRGVRAAIEPDARASAN